MPHEQAGRLWVVRVWVNEGEYKFLQADGYLGTSPVRLPAAIARLAADGYNLRKDGYRAEALEDRHLRRGLPG
jgi:hypothetical protein